MDEQDQPPAGSPVGRRIVLGMLGLGAVGVVTGNWLSRTTSSVAAAIAPGAQAALPALGGFRYYTVTNDFPSMSTADYGLSVSVATSPGAKVERLSFTDLSRLPQTSIVKDFQCVTGWRVDDVHWSGVRLSDVLEATGVDTSAPALRFTSFDGAYTESLTMQQAQLPDVLVATSLNNSAIDAQAGGPVRLVMPQMYGYKSIKWLNGIYATDTVKPGYWEVRGYDVDAWVGKSNGRSDEPVT